MAGSEVRTAKSRGVGKTSIKSGGTRVQTHVQPKRTKNGK